MSVVLRLLPLLLSAFLSSCAAIPLKDPLPAPLSLALLGSADRNAAAALSPNGSLAAWGDDGLKLRALSGEEVLSVSEKSPERVAFAPDGRVLAAAFAADGGSTVKLLDLAGREKGRIDLPLQVERLVWSDGELFVLGSSLQRYRFGMGLMVSLYRWKAGSSPVETKLYSTTLRTATGEAWEALRREVRLSVSPYGDEILYDRIFDPPAFQPFRRLMLRHLETSVERQAGPADGDYGVGTFSADGEGVILSAGDEGCIMRDLWNQKSTPLLRAPCTAMAMSPGGRYLLVEGRLHDRGNVLASFPADTEGVFAGERLLLRWKDRLYLVSGLSPDPPPELPQGEAREKILSLRAWRSKGLLTPEEYALNRERVLNK